MRGRAYDFFPTQYTDACENERRAHGGEHRRRGRPADRQGRLQLFRSAPDCDERLPGSLLGLPPEYRPANRRTTSSRPASFQTNHLLCRIPCRARETRTLKKRLGHPSGRLKVHHTVHLSFRRLFLKKRPISGILLFVAISPQRRLQRQHMALSSNGQDGSFSSFKSGFDSL